VVQVNWKAAATVVTGATALAGWLTTPSSPQAPVRPRAMAAQTRPLASRDVAHAAAIEEQSLRLAARLRPGGSYAQPQRDPFHFGARNPAPSRATASRRARVVAEAPASVAAVEPPPFPYRLSGLASDTVDGRPTRTAVLSGGDTGLVLAASGDVVGGVYRVDRIDETAVELTDTRDGLVVRLTFTTP
jgi:hypothetical protein